MIELEPHEQGCVLPIRAHAGARRSGLGAVHGGMLKVAVTQVAEKGKANKAILELLAAALGLNRSQLELSSGRTSPRKRVLVRGLGVEEVRRRLGNRATPG